MRTETDLRRGQPWRAGRVARLITLLPISAESNERTSF
jgi:hypothetical protein